tara:strand:- start:11503 stop:13056 length:1554 start_codon:yes stop_codon:yes gene_type:complete
MFNLPILRTQKEFDTWKRDQVSEIIFVPTMGGLHEGHKRLIEVASKLSEEKPSVVLLSIFVNPLQFEDSEDFKNYPRDLENDIKIATKAGAHAIWVPTLEEIFPGGIQSHFKLIVPNKFQLNLCGANRKGHFDGVATIIIRFINIVKPSFLILGEKDWQQLIIIKKLIQDMNLNIKIKSVPTKREKDNLACSSRNKYLNDLERKYASYLPKALRKIAKNYYKNGNINLQKIKTSLEKNGLTVEYLQVVDPENLQLIDHPSNLCLLGAAVQIGKTRLIDHTFLMNRYPIVAIDGPAGAGKSTVTKVFAKKMGLMYLDTGAMYRAVTWLIQERNIELDDKNNIKKALSNMKLNLTTSNSGHLKVIINDEDVTDKIRDPKVTSKVSQIASYRCVRESLTLQQKQIGLKGGLVAEGRDIGTTVFPDAELKVFLTASAKERAKRRAIDLKKMGYNVPSLIDLEKEICNRDDLDISREISPLIKAEDAKELITDGMTIENVVEYIIEIFRLKVPEEVWPTPQS